MQRAFETGGVLRNGLPGSLLSTIILILHVYCEYKSATSGCVANLTVSPQNIVVNGGMFKNGIYYTAFSPTPLKRKPFRV